MHACKVVVFLSVTAILHVCDTQVPGSVKFITVNHTICIIHSPELQMYSMQKK